MLRTLLLALLTLASLHSVCQPVTFSFPLHGQCSVDYWIDYLVDHDPGPGVKDAKCGRLTYNDHKGTDILLRNFAAMDSGVAVYAVADGIVTSTADGKFDREKQWKNVPDCGNYVVMRHGAYTVKYCQLRKQSVLVHVGDKIRRGQQIGQVGSSGYSAHPHLHLEVLDRNNKVIDPVSGPCSSGNNGIRWDKPLCYDTGKYPIESGFMRFVPTVDTLKEGMPAMRRFTNEADSIVCFWALMHGVRNGDKLEFKWYGPTNAVYASSSVDWKDDWWHNYAWSYLKTPLQSGVWHVELYVNKQLFYRMPFTVLVN